MEKHYNENENVPQELAADELVYVHTPFLNNKYQGIRRLNVQARGPFVIVEMIQGRLARVSDFSKLPRLVNISRLRVTKLGMDPPKFMENSELNPDHYHDWIPNDVDVDQPWDQMIAPKKLLKHHSRNWQVAGQMISWVMLVMRI